MAMVLKWNEQWPWRAPQEGDVITIAVSPLLHKEIKAMYPNTLSSAMIDPNEALIFLRLLDDKIYFKRPFNSDEHWVIRRYAKVTLVQPRGKLWESDL